MDDLKLPAASPAEVITNAFTQLLREHTGRGPDRARTYINDDLVTVVFQGVLSKAEAALAAGGQETAVTSIRAAFQNAMRDELVAVVEQATGRSVAAFLSANHLDPDLAIESFFLRPSASAVPIEVPRS